MYNNCGIFVYVVCILLLLMYATENVRSDYILSINAESKSRRLFHFWESTGFCPFEPRSNISQYLSSSDVKINLALIGSLPNRSIKQVRVHWLLDLVSISIDDYNQSNEVPSFNFTNLDSFINWLHLQKLYPGFELMGNPSNYFNNFLDSKQKTFWELLVHNIAVRYSDKFGIENVLKWRFELWNEPDLRGYNILNFTLASYMSYVSASATGLQSASTQLSFPEEYKHVFKLGGPAGLFKSPTKHPLCWGLISECAARDSLDCPLHFISYHKKGDSSARAVVQKGLELVDYIRNMHPKLKGLPVANDEADILTGWSKSKEWRADVRYASMVVKVIIDHYNEFIKKRGINIEILSNDNGFLNYHPYYFTQRTLLARFQINNTHPPHIQFFKKPVYTTMGLLSYLGTKVLDIPISNNFSFLFTKTFQRNIYEYTLILSYVNDTQLSNNKTGFEIVVKNLPKVDFMYVVYLLDNNVTNPYAIWKNNWSPKYPNATTRAKMRHVEGPFRLRGPTFLKKGENLKLKFYFILPTVALLHLCSKGDENNLPGRIIHLQVFNVTFNEVIILWKTSKNFSKCVRTYEIDFLQSDIYNNGTEQFYKRINTEDIIFLWYQFVTTKTTQGIYRVRAIDYWGRKSPYSGSIKYP